MKCKVCGCETDNQTEICSTQCGITDKEFELSKVGVVNKQED